jgi:hypothetical protein
MKKQSWIITLLVGLVAVIIAHGPTFPPDPWGRF